MEGNRTGAIEGDGPHHELSSGEVSGTLLKTKKPGLKRPENGDIPHSRTAVQVVDFVGGPLEEKDHKRRKRGKGHPRVGKRKVLWCKSRK